MSWPRVSWIIEPIVLFFLLGLLIKIFVTNSKKIDSYTEKMWESTKKSQAFLQQIDHEFDVMNMCAKSIKSVFLNFSKIYKEISQGTKTVDEAIREAKNNIPDELRNLSGLFLTEDSGNESTALSQGICSSSDLEVTESKQVFSDMDKSSTTTVYKIVEDGKEAKGYDLELKKKRKAVTLEQ